MSLQSEHHSNESKYAARGTEVFVGGLPRTISEEKIREVFSSCGEIVEIRTIKDHTGNLKGFGFVRFATKEAAGRAVRDKSGTLLDGKKIGVLPSTEQDTLYVGNLNKAWGADEFEKIVLQVFSDVVSVDLAMLKDMQPQQNKQNRGFAFVKFSSHAVYKTALVSLLKYASGYNIDGIASKTRLLLQKQQAASRAHRVGTQPDFRLGNLHPAVQWAQEEPGVDSEELAKIKIAFVRNLPMDADENFLKQLFEPFGKVEKVVVSKKGSSPVGFVHFAERSDLDRSIRELNEKTVQGYTGGQIHKLQIEVARPMDRNKKRARDDLESNPAIQSHAKSSKENPSVATSTNHNFIVQRVPESIDPYEAAVIALPLAVKERLLRILRLGIATRFDIDVESLSSLKELPESNAISVLDQFMLSGAALQNKGAYLAGLISKHLVDRLQLSRSLGSLTKVADASAKESKLLSFSHQMSPPAIGSFTSHAYSAMARSDMYGLQYASPLSDYPFSSRTLMGRAEEKGSDLLMSNRALSGSQNMQLLGSAGERGSNLLMSNRALSESQNMQLLGNSGERGSNLLISNRTLSGSENFHIPRIVGSRERSHSPFDTPPGSSISYGRVGLRMEESNVSPLPAAPSSSTSYARHGVSLSSNVTGVSDRQASRPQMRFDPFTGEPYKFDPFTGEPIVPESGTRRF